jgi:hypothetical protein
LAQHPQASAHYQQNAGQHYEHTAATAAQPWAVRALGLEVTAAAKQAAVHRFDSYG